MTARPVDYARPLLTARRIEILRLYACGHDTAGVASALFVSESTVKTHLRITCQRLGAVTRTQAVAVAMALGLLPVRDITIPEPRQQLVTGIPGGRWAP